MPPNEATRLVSPAEVTFEDNGDRLADDDDSSTGGREFRRVSPEDRTLSVFESLADIKENIVETVVETLEEVKEVATHVVEEIEEVLEEEVAEPVKAREGGDHSQKLSALALAVLVFYKVSGGPFGCEPTVKAAGPFFAIVGFIVFPFLWCVPEALVTAELGSAYPEPSGAIAWVEEAFGPRAGLLSGYFHWVSGATDNAIYPSLFLEYISEYIGVRDNLLRFVFSGAISIVLAYVNFKGLEVVGNLSMVICVISLSPFVLLCIWGIPKLDTSRWLVMPEQGIILDDDEPSGFLPQLTWLGVMWKPFVNNLWWNLNSFDVGASFAGEVKDPERVFPKAMFLSVVMVTASYILPLLAAIGAADSDQDDWNAGYFTTAATKIAGPWLGAWLIFAAAVSNIALFEAELSGDAYQLMGMADRGLIPKLFCKRSRYDTPTNGILLGTAVIIAMGVANFDQLVEMLNFAYSISMLLEFAAFIKLRVTDADVERPFKLPLSTFGCFLFIIPPSLICCFLLISASKMTYIYFSILSLFGLAFVFLQKFAKHYSWVEYAEAPPPRRGESKLSPYQSSSINV
jgi:amino acid transporter